MPLWYICICTLYVLHGNAVVAILCSKYVLSSQQCNLIFSRQAGNLNRNSQQLASFTRDCAQKARTASWSKIQIDGRLAMHGLGNFSADFDSDAVRPNEPVYLCWFMLFSGQRIVMGKMVLDSFAITVQDVR